MDTNIASPPRNVAPRLASNRWSDATKQTLDADLIRRIVAGNKLGMQLLYMRHNVRLFRFALRFTRNKATAEDLVQEVFLDVWRKADEFKGRSEVSTWLLAIVRNKALTVMRHRSADQLDEDAAACIADSADTPEMAMQKEQARSITCKCLTQLSPAHREIIDLVYYHGESIEDVSKIIGIPGSTVKTRMFYARKHLAELLCRQGSPRRWPSTERAPSVAHRVLSGVYSIGTEHEDAGADNRKSRGSSHDQDIGNRHVSIRGGRHDRRRRRPEGLDAVQDGGRSPL